MKFIVGIKKGMTQVFDAEGRVYPVTIVSVSKVAVTQIKTPETDGYASVQIGFGSKAEKNIAKAQLPKGTFANYKEFEVEDISAFTVGDIIEPSIFGEGDIVSVAGLSKGRGFQGAVKRHGFAGGRRSHGQKHSEREVGSIGGGPGRAGGRVVKGMKMAGRMGGNRVHVKNLSIVRVDSETGEIYVRGAVPGRHGTYVEVCTMTPNKEKKAK